MKIAKFALSFATLALAVASAKGPVYKFTLLQATVVAGSEIKAGDYKVEVNGDKATIMAGKTVVEAPVKVETGTEKFGLTSVECSTTEGKNVLDDIRVGGTKTTLVFKK